MKKPHKIFSLIAFSCLFSVIAFAQDSSITNIPGEIQEEAVNFLEMVAKGNPEEIYSRFDLELKKEADIEKTKTIISELKRTIGTINKVELINSEYQEDEGGIYSLVYDVETNGIKLRYTVHVKQTGKGIFVRGFNFDSQPSSSTSKQVNRQGINILHFIVGFLFVLCIAVQLWCVIYFVKKKGLKKKWLYIILSFLGFPCGIGINWLTGAFSVSFGVNIPAVAISWPLDSPGMWLMTVYFPFGVIFLIKEMAKKKVVDR